MLRTPLWALLTPQGTKQTESLPSWPFTSSDRDTQDPTQAHHTGCGRYHGQWGGQGAEPGKGVGVEVLGCNRALAGVAPLDGVWSHTPKGCGFSPRSGHTPRLWV